MARLPRPDIAGIAQHVVQRGTDRLPCFLDDVDRRLYLQALRDMSMRYACETGVRVDFLAARSALFLQTRVFRQRRLGCPGPASTSRVTPTTP